MNEGYPEEQSLPGTGPTNQPEDLALHVLHSLDQPICIIDPDDCFFFVNKAFASQYGVSPQSMRGWPVRELIGEAFYDKRIKALLARARKDGSSDFSGWIDYPERGRRFVEALIELYAHPDLVDKRYLIIQYRDITEREELDQHRRKSLDFQEGLLGSVPSMVWISGKDGVPYFYNESWLNFTGYTLVEQVREGWLGMVHPDDRQVAMDRIQYAIANRDQVEVEFRLRYLMGGYRWVRLIGRPVGSNSEGREDFIVAALDMDDSRKRYEEVNRNLEDERYLRDQALLQKAAADRANREKSAYLSLASHEIRTPMNPVIGFADLLASNPDLDGDSKEMAQMILKAGKNLLMLLDEVLDYAKIEAGVLELSPEPLNVHDLLIELDNLYSFDAKSRGIELRVSDRIRADAELYQDRIRLQQVLGTLITNAIKFTHTGHVEVEADIEDVRLNGTFVQMLKFSITDTGVGMNEEQLAKLFQPFAKADSEFSDKYTGTGLGLAIAQKLIDAMQGTVKVESELGKGSRVELVLPMTQVPDHLKRPSNPFNSVLESNHSSNEQAASVMIVDDEESSRQVNGSLMQFLGYRCDSVEDGQELMEQLRKQTYELILLDIMMPGLDGFEVTRRIRNGDCGEGNREAYIIAVTGCVQQEDRDRGFKAGINAYLTKPLTIQDLKDTIKDYNAMKA